ncbi:hypothetical protein pb186bvf_012838 [Paramecium bursaria]
MIFIIFQIDITKYDYINKTIFYDLHNAYQEFILNDIIYKMNQGIKNPHSQQPGFPRSLKYNLDQLKIHIRNLEKLILSTVKQIQFIILIGQKLNLLLISMIKSIFQILKHPISLSHWLEF